MNAVIKFEPATLTRAEAEELFKPLVSAVLDGDLDPLIFRAAAKALEAGLDASVARTNGVVIRELDKYRSEGGVVVNGIRLFVRNSGDRLDYAKDKEYRRLSDLLDERKELLRIATRQRSALANATTGELVEPVPIKTHGKDTVYTEWNE